jgi:hypothetical protein
MLSLISFSSVIPPNNKPINNIIINITNQSITKQQQHKPPFLYAGNLLQGDLRQTEEYLFYKCQQQQQ